ncbi:hypothetical protein B5X24_HaOG213330 [Helicoverpa armigera]|nr:hypothetical protein B5X24_HaOG213330 [Helicoverpa armigera]
MAKRKKAAPKTAATRRTTRRAKQQAEAASSADGEASASVELEPTASEPAQQGTETAPTDATPAPDPQTSETSDKSENSLTTPCQVPIVALHKKFGKYRCLFNSDETFTRKYDIGSDSETNSSVEIRVVDPCASSESDSNAAIDTQSDTNSGANFSPVNSTTVTQSNSRDISPVPAPCEPSSQCEPTSQCEPSSQCEPTPQCEMPSSIPVEKEEETEKPEEVNTIDLTESDSKLSAITEQVVEDKDDCQIIDDSSIPEEKPEEIPAEDIPMEGEQIEFTGDDDEVITIVQIVEDDHPELYYNIKIDSPSEHVSETADNEEIKENCDNSEFQINFEKLNLAVETDPPMDCSEGVELRTPPCLTPDIPFKENLIEGLTRPDPSLTPSSTLSDDSNSSRVTEQNQNNSNDSAESSPTGVRRSSRIKTISNMKQKTKGYGLVKTPLKKALITQAKMKLEEIGSDSQEKTSESLPNTQPNSPSFPVPSEMPVKVKSRWRRSSELEMGASSPANSPLASPSLPQQRLPPVAESPSLPDEEPSAPPLSKEDYDRIIEERMNQYQHLDENEYLCERMISKETKKMTCDCFMTKEELERGELACGEDCLNRLLMIECNSRCPVGDRCTNRRFQSKENAPLRVFYADKKGCGVEAIVDIPTGEFLLEYVGEVLDYEQFYKRAQAYSDENNLHHYFMSLKGDTVIDATLKGNISRFINHSCDPNAETQKWTVNGELRIGFFSKRDIVAGEELTFDYQFQRFGKVAQRCYCGADNCRGWIGGEPDSDDEDDEEEEDVSTSKSGTTESSEESLATPTEQPRPRVRRPKKDRTYKPKAPDLVQDADIEEDLEALGRTGVKNQSHTLRLSRTVVRAKSRRAQTALLRLLRDADLPCRRLFLDYRGLRLLAPWCSDAPLDFKLEMLQTVDRLPIPNKTMVQESRFFTIVERWLSAADAPQPAQENVFIDEATGLPIELPNRGSQENLSSPEKAKDNASILEKIKDLSNQLLERWSSLKEVFKIPKKERIQQMKEHERQANVERRAADSSGSRDRERDRRDERERDRREEREREREKERERERERDRDRDRSDRDRSDRDRGERDRDRYRERDRDRDRERDRDDRDRRKRRSSPEGGRRSIRLSERVLAAVPPMSKEERRRAFAEAAAAADDMMGMPGFPMGGFMFGLDSPLVRRQTKGKVVEGVNGIYEVIKDDGHNGLIPDHALVSIKPRKRRPGLVSERPISPRTEEDKLAGRLEVKRYKQTKEKLRRRREKLLQKVRLLAANKSQRRLKGNMIDLKDMDKEKEIDKDKDKEIEREKEIEKEKEMKKIIEFERKIIDFEKKKDIAKEPECDKNKQMVELVDSETDSEDSSTEEVVPTPTPVEKPVEKPIELEASPSPVIIPSPPPAEVSVVTTEETARKIKEQFRCSMARVMVQHLNPYRHPDAPAARITCTADFKHLARKLTHFVMLKELKHCRSVDELIVTDSVRSKAKMFVKKYMAKFGPVYKRPPEEID